MITNNSSNLSVTDVNDKEIKIRSLKNSYNFIIKIDLVKDTVECIHKNIARPVGISYDVVLTIESARNYFLNNYVFSDDYEIVETFFQKIVNLKTLENLNDCDEPIQAVCSFRFDDETIRKYSAVVVVLDLSNVLLCGKDITDVVYSQELISKSNILEKIRTYLNAVFDNYHIQVITFEILNRKVYPIFFGKKMCDIMSIRTE